MQVNSYGFVSDLVPLVPPGARSAPSVDLQPALAQFLHFLADKPLDMLLKYPEKRSFAAQVPLLSIVIYV